MMMSWVLVSMWDFFVGSGGGSVGMFGIFLLL